MTQNEFREMALGFAGTEERSHMGHPDFRVGGKIFATLGPDGDCGMVKLTAEQQAVITRTDLAFAPASGAWGRQGSTIVTLAAADESTVRQALSAAWRNAAPKKLIRGTESL